MVLVSMFWMTEAAPLAITALLPAVLFPLMGIMSSRYTCELYTNQTNMMFFGGITLALAVEYCMLHERIALFVILKIGQSPRRLLMGFMLTTMMLSMWISNTAATAMMIPIVDAVMLALSECTPRTSTSVSSPQCASFDLSPVESTAQLHDDFPPDMSSNGDLTLASSTKALQPGIGTERPLKQQLHPQYVHLRNVVLLSIAYSANLGGTGTATGTNPNLVLTGYLGSTYGAETGLNYATWMLFAVPNMMLATVVVFVAMMLQTISLRNFLSKLLKRFSWKTSPSSYSMNGGAHADHSPEAPKSSIAAQQEAAVRRVLQVRYDNLGSLSFHETAVASVFVVLVLLWFARSPQFMPGWGEIFDVDGVVMTGGATPALLAVFILFIIPAKPETLRNKEYDHNGGLLTWKVVRDRFPWEVLLIMGGGFALAEGASTSGLSIWISDRLRVFENLPSPVAVFLICLLTATMTEVMSNTAVISILLPVLKELAVVLQVNPLYLMFPATLSSSFAFMLPVATPPNALVFSAATVRTVDMIRIGFILNLLCLLVITLTINTLGPLIFDLYTSPAWANTTITT